jgi:hypothetical protein
MYVPPQVHQNDVVTACQIQARAPCFEGDEDDRDPGIVLDGFQRDLSLVVRHGTVI